jgi:hypothetical protein
VTLNLRRHRVEQSQSLLSQLSSRSSLVEQELLASSDLYLGHMLEFQSAIALKFGDIALMDANEASFATFEESYRVALIKLDRLAAFSPEPTLIGPKSLWRESFAQLSPKHQLRAHYLLCMCCISKANNQLESVKSRNLPSDNLAWRQLHDEIRTIVARSSFSNAKSSSSRPFSEVYGRIFLLLGKFYYYYSQATSSVSFLTWKPISISSVTDVLPPSAAVIEQLLQTFMALPSIVSESENRAQICLETAFLACAELRIPALSREICLLLGELLGRAHPER